MGRERGRGGEGGWMVGDGLEWDGVGDLCWEVRGARSGGEIKGDEDRGGGGKRFVRKREDWFDTV